MAIQVGGQVGPQLLGDGTIGANFRQEKTGGLITQDLHGRFYEQAQRSALYTHGMTLTSISNGTFTTSTLTASCTPIVGVWNPATSPVNVVVLQATLGVVLSALQATGCGPFVWAVSTGNAAISTGTAPWNCKNLTQTGSFAKGFSAGTALTGLTNSLVVMRGSSLGGGSNVQAAFLATQVAMQNAQISAVENFDGGLIVPPGGVLALLATGTGVAHSAVSGLVWEEVLA